MKIQPTTLQKVIKSLSITLDEEITCGECYQEVDKFVDMLRDGKKPSEVLPLVEHHLTLCPPCKEEFEALLIALSAVEDTSE
jgi:hypothetical protein